jgi:hypothetical protein
MGLLVARGQRALLAGELDSAVGDFGDAAVLARQLVAENPGESRWLGGLGNVLYSLDVRHQRPGASTRAAGVRNGLLVVASYWLTTLAGMRPRSLTARPVALAHARMSTLR